MSLDDDRKKKIVIEDEEGSEGESGQGGKSGQIEFRDFVTSTQNLRDDLLSSDDKRNLLRNHENIHELKVKKQKDLRDQRHQVKDGKIPLQTYRQGVMGTGMNAQYNAHPFLNDKAQFSGTDRQVNALPTENVAETNDAKRDELQYQYQLRFAPDAPKFNPKPLYR